MDEELLDCDVLIDNQRWSNFYSEILPVEQSEVNLESTMLDKSTNPLESQLDDSSIGFECDPMVHNKVHVTSDKNVDCVNLKPEEDFNYCMDQIELWTKRARLVYKEKESAVDYCNVNQDFLQQEIKQRDEAILRLQEEIEKEKVKGSQQVYELKREPDQYDRKRE